MKTVVIHEFGEADRLVIEERPVPDPGPGEVTINVAFAGVGFIDILVRKGAFAFAGPPLTPGVEVSGIVRAVGYGVQGFKPGQRVAALLSDFTAGGMGGYAEVARAKAALTVALHGEDDFATAAATIMNGATAFLAVEGLDRDSVVVVSGASGGLGQCLIAAASHAGAASIVAVSGNAARAEAILRLGATNIVAPDAFASIESKFNAAFDTVGGELRLNMLHRLADAGRLVLLGNASGDDVLLPGDEIWLRSLRVEGLATGGLSALMPNIIATAATTAIINARLHPPAFAVMNFVDAAEAHRMVEQRQGPGKIILQVA